MSWFPKLPQLTAAQNAAMLESVLRIRHPRRVSIRLKIQL
jgi:hypothetical protein